MSMNISVGDKLKLKKKVGHLNTIGMVFTVNSIEDDVIHFNNEFGSGAISASGITEFFDIIKKNNYGNFHVGQTIKLVDVIEGLEPMKAGYKFRVDEITSTGVTKLNCFDNNKTYWIATSVVNDCFEADVDDTVENVDNGDVKFYNIKAKIKTVVEISEEEIADNDCDAHYIMCGFHDNDGNTAIPMSVNENYIDSLLENADIVVDTLDDGITTIVTATLSSGFAITETHTSVNTLSHDENENITMCLAKIRYRLDEMERYYLFKATEYDKSDFDVVIKSIDCDSVPSCEVCPMSEQCSEDVVQCNGDCADCPEFENHHN